jgi:tetratricopeptide (TPR) repeat protein
VLLIQKNLHSNRNPELLSRVIPIIDEGIKISNSYKMYYYRSLLFLFLGFIGEAFDDIDRAIEKCEENVAAFFYIRGIIFFLERNYKNAIE